MLKFPDSDIASLVSPDAIRVFLQHVTRLDLPENELILSPGQQQQHLYFIKKGVVRSYYKVFGNEWTNWFAAEGNPAFSTESFLNGNPSTEFIETCTPVSFYSISKQEFQQFLNEFPNLYQLAFVFMHRYMSVAENRMYGLHVLTAYERYERFIETHKNIVNRVKMQHIASYLGITPTHFSRVRKEYAQRG
ncbi:Crp/Fnr family transcriptional regulator [Dyadobacter psychrotolerans]|uniref:Crp/Fnr family transcriptional regulator n=1 Tax=Dyadobacter psychrotolerans TaxID=2541721 RepID=A0A4R5D8W4_9BACT|nr:Crp/Fnr family transcriptional regulator [Dyadobacter psychrotolerans]TDE10012.1 Crp/Fnr family transcriptional regulator [Dyadobacter psychrotolerans]